MYMELIEITPERTGIVIWLVWAVIGLVAALVAKRVTGRGTLFFDVIIGVVAALLGGTLSVSYVGGGPVQLFLISVLGAIFFAAAALLLTGWRLSDFRRKDRLYGGL